MTALRPTYLVTADELVRLGATPPRAARFAGPLSETMARYAITTPRRMQHFLAQVFHESGRLAYTSELWGPTAAQKRYEGRADLGNTRPGDGYRFRGHGLIQLTGRANHAAYARAAGLGTAEAAAEALEADPYLQADVAGWFWDRAGLNAHADADDLRAVTRRINGGYNGLEDRRRLLLLARVVIRETPPGVPAIAVPEAKAPEAKAPVPDRMEPKPPEPLPRPEPPEELRGGSPEERP